MAAVGPARDAVRLEPGEPDGLRILSSVLCEVGERREAYDAAVRAVHLAPNEWQSHLAVSQALVVGPAGHDRGAIGTAEAAARRAVELAPHEPTPT